MHVKGNKVHDVALCQNAFDWEINMYGMVLIQESVNDESYTNDMIYHLYILLFFDTKRNEFACDKYVS